MLYRSHNWFNIRLQKSTHPLFAAWLIDSTKLLWRSCIMITKLVIYLKLILSKPDIPAHFCSFYYLISLGAHLTWNLEWPGFTDRDLKARFVFSTDYTPELTIANRWLDVVMYLGTNTEVLNIVDLLCRSTLFKTQSLDGALITV